MLKAPVDGSDHMCKSQADSLPPTSTSDTFLRNAP